MKYRFLLCLALAFVLSFSCVFANTDYADKTQSISPKVIIDGNEIEFNSVRPYITDGRTLVPLRTIFEALDAQVFWYEKTNSVVAVKDTNLIELKIGDKTALKNNEQIVLDVPAEIVNSRTVVPLRFVSESLGAKVDFNDETKTIYIDTKKNAEDISSPSADEKFKSLADCEVIFSNTDLKQAGLSGGSLKQSNGDILRVSVTNNFENSYNSQLNLKVGSTSFVTGDIMLCSIKARAVSSEKSTAKFGIVHEEASGNYKKSVSAEYELVPGGDWQTIYLPYTIVVDMEKNASQLNIRLGYCKQEIEFTDFTLMRCNNCKFEDLPSMNTTYTGREENAEWRKEAWDRIEKYRKSDFSVTVADAEGNPVSDADISVEMTNHEFSFGTAIKADYINSTAAKYDTYKKYLSLFFNSGLTENALKRPNWAANSSRAVNAVDTLNEMGFKNLRGHTMVWDRWDKLPDNFKTDYSVNTPEKMEEETLAHISEIGTAMRGKVTDWDVANEVIQNHAMRDILGDETLVNWFKAAKEADPNAVLYLNENTVQTINSPNASAFYELVKNLKAMGAPIEGIGLQCHFNTASNPEDFVELINYYSDLNCDIKITEFDFQCPDKQLQADFTKDLIIAAYSCPEVKGFIMWGFQDSAHWLSDAPLFYEDWTLKPSGGAYIKTVFDTLWTKTYGKSDTNGCFSGNGFHGDYKITVTYKDKVYTLNDSISNTKDNNFTITIN